MKLSELINIAGLGRISGEHDPEITGVQSDSRLVEPGSLFVAVKGTAVDGHDYIAAAIGQGAVAVVCEHAAAPNLSLALHGFEQGHLSADTLGYPPGIPGNAPEASGNVPEASGNVPEASGNVPEASGNVPEASGNAPETSGNVPEALGNAPKASGNVPEALGNVPEALGKAPEASGNVPEASGNVPEASGKAPEVSGNVPEAARKAAVFITIPDSADALGRIASAWYGEPSSQMTVVGVTGTNGKTTIATLLYNLFRKLGYKAGLLSTVCNYIDGEAIPASHTTPDPLTINRLMAKMVDAGCEYVFMEASSHAIDQKRISGLDFNGGIFTNLTRDHLDYHLTVENYLKAKKKFFDALPASAFALTNADDKSGMVMLQNTSARKLTYSLRTMADYKGRIVESHFDGTEMHINGRDVYTHFTGRFNAYNLLAVYGAAVALGEDSEETLIALSTLRPVSGRFETIRSPQGFTAVVDYAHTPDALENVLNGIREVLNGDGRVITVVGAGGNRDKGKRPLMAKEAVRQSDLLILTSDNPRFEEPDDIINDMTAGLNASDRERTICIADRRQAIKTAVTLARKGDVILVAGKGHEDYQEIKGVKHHFDDREIIREIFKIDNK